MKRKIIDCNKRRHDHVCKKNADKDGYCKRCGAYVGETD